MANACPISGKRIDARAARVNGAIAISVLALAVFIPAMWLLIPLGIDFFVKAAFGLRKSPLCKVSRSIVDAMGLEPQWEDEAPKRFAAALGFVFSAGGAIAWYAGAQTLGLVLVCVFAACALLEAGAGICIGCKVYGLVSPFFTRTRATIEPIPVRADND